MDGHTLEVARVVSSRIKIVESYQDSCKIDVSQARGSQGSSSKHLACVSNSNMMISSSLEWFSVSFDTIHTILPTSYSNKQVDQLYLTI